MQTGTIPNAHRSVEEAGTSVNAEPVLPTSLRDLLRKRLQILALIETAAKEQNEAEVIRLTAALIHARDRARKHVNQHVGFCRDLPEAS